MIDATIKNQLTELFKDLGCNIELVVAKSVHEKQAELMHMLEAVASTSNALSVRLVDTEVTVPQFSIYRNGQDTGVGFRGIPGGHEFSSFVLAILNSAGRGKVPDPGLQHRIKRLRGPISIKTYISLTCENCPDVVQALNQIALTHPEIAHEMVDGAFVQDELDRFGIQGVPAVFVDDELLHSGRSSLVELLSKLEAKLGVADEDTSRSGEALDLGHFDVAVVGGGPAGASAAIYSVRKGLKTVLIAEKIGGQVQETKGIENLTSVVYTEGPQLSASFDQHLRSYPVQILEHRRVKSVTGVDGGSNSKQITLDSGERLSCDALIVATGAKWRELGVPGEKEYLGRGVAFCPHCDGPYYKGKKVAVVGGGNSGVEAAIDLAGICSEVVLFEFTDKLKADEVLIAKLKALSNVSIITNAKTKAVPGNGEKVVGLTYEDRATGVEHTLALDGVFVQIGLSPNSAVVKDVVEINRFGEIVVDAKGRTSVPGIYAAGDVTTVPFKQIVIAMGDGAKVALTAFEDRMRAS